MNPGIKVVSGGTLVLLSALVAAYLAGGTPVRPANLWVVASGGASPCIRLATPATYDDAPDSAKCRTVQLAYNAAECGDLVRLKNATSYGSLSITSGSKDCDAGSMIRFRPEDDNPNRFGHPASVKANGVSVTTPGAWVEFEDIDLFNDGANATTAGTINAANAPVPDVHVVFRRIDAQTVFIRAKNVSVIGGSAGGFEACDFSFDDAIVTTYDIATGVPSSDILIDGMLVHDISRIGCDDHADSMQMLAGQRITVRNSTFVNGPTESIIGRPQGSVPLSDITIENNMIGDSAQGTQAVNIGSGTDACSNITIRHNSSSETINVDCVGSGNTVTDNIASACGLSGASGSSNIGTNCGTGSRSCTPAWATANPAATGDFHIALADTCAKDHGSGTAPSMDFDGDARPLGAAADIGADEVG